MKRHLVCGGPGTGKGELRVRRINALDLGWRAPFDDQFGESPAAAADIDPSHSWSWRKPVEKYFAGEAAPSPHIPLIAGPIVIADLAFSHCILRSMAIRRSRGRRLAGVMVLPGRIAPIKSKHTFGPIRCDLQSLGGSGVALAILRSGWGSR